MWIDLGTITVDLTGLSITSNAGFVGATFVGSLSVYRARTPFPAVNDLDASYGNHCSTPGLYIGSNAIRGAGKGLASVLDSRFICISGTSASPCIVELNAIDHCHRLGHLIGSYVTFRKNLFGLCYHHGFTGSVFDDTYTTNIGFENNLFYCDRGASSNFQSAAIQLSYNHRITTNNYVVANNTVDGWTYGCLDFADTVDQSGWTLATNVAIVDNIISNGTYAFSD